MSSAREPKLVGGQIVYPSHSQSLLSGLPYIDSRSFSLESALLREARGGLLRCARGVECRGLADFRLIPGLSVPVVLAASMSLEELSRRTGMADAEKAVETLLTSPVDARTGDEPCVLCQRYEQVRMIIEHRRLCNMEHEKSPIDKIRDGLHVRRVRKIQAYSNPVDVQDGYRSEWMLHPQADDPFFYPVVDAPLSVLFARKTVLGWRVFQCGLEYHTAPLLLPRPGTRIADFIASVRDTDAYDHETHAKRLRVSLDFTPLRDSWCRGARRWSFDDKYQPVIDPSGQVNTERLFAVVDRKLRSADEYHLQACRLSDAFASDEPDLALIISSATLEPRWHQTVSNLAYFVSLSKENNALLHQLSKSALKQRCQTRNAHDMIIKHMVTRELVKKTYVYDGKLFLMCKDLLLCTLLGNYSDRSRALTLSERRELVRFFHEGRSRRWVMNLFVKCPAVLNVCIRDFMADQWRHRPALRSIIEDLVHPDAYAEINCDLVDKMRKIIMDHRNEWDLLPNQECSLARMWTCGIKDCSMPCPHALLNPQQFRALIVRASRKRDTLEEMMDHVMEMVKPELSDVEWSRPTEAAIHETDDKNERAVGWRWQATEMHDKLRELDFTDDDGYRRPFVESREIFRSTGAAAHARMDLSEYEPRHKDCLNKVTERVSAAASALFQRFKHREINHTEAKQQWLKLPLKVRNEITRIDWNIQLARKQPVILELSLSLANSQKQCIDSENGLFVGALHYCVVVCRRCNSLKRPAGRHHGMKDVKVSFVTDEVSCSKCEGELAWYNLLGRVMFMDRQMHAFCSRCGFLTSSPVMRNDLVCGSCACLPRPAIEQFYKRAAREGVCAITTCARAERGKLTEASAYWLFSDDYQHVFLCTRHFSPSMLTALNPPASSEEIVQRLNAMCKKRRCNA